MTRVVTVLKCGGDFNRGHVERLREQVRFWAPGIEFICLSDDPLVPGYRPLEHNWPGWWSKMEIYRQPGPCLYIDLDTTIVSNLGPLLRACEEHDFIVLRDFNPKQRLLGTGLMGWCGTTVKGLYANFREHPRFHMERHRSPRWWGDQGFIEKQVRPEQLTFWQDILPDQIVSYKKHCLAGVPARARVVCFHGKPRPWDLEQEVAA